MKHVIQTLNKYDSIEEINEGANAYSFSAVHRHLNHKRFLKLIDLPAGADESILREPQELINAIQAQPTCENIVRLFDVDRVQFEQDTFALLQMEFLNGTSLQRLLTTRNFGQQEAVRLIMAILHGVAHLHRQRLLHRDLKPGNILLHNSIPKIADFGSIAKASDGVDFVNASKHSDLYVPPEGWDTPPRYTFSSDVYQTMLVLYQLINGAFPTNGNHYLTKRVANKLKKAGKAYETLDRFEAATAEKESLAELTTKETLIYHALQPRPYYAQIVDRIIRKAVRVDLSRRFQSAEECIKKLSGVSVPNWRPVGNSFEAPSWKGWDWTVDQVSGRKGVIFVVSKRRGSNNYRSCFKTPDLTEGFAFVEAWNG